MASDQRTWTLVTAAGTSDRFRQLGHLVPKAVLRIAVDGRDDLMVNHVLETAPTMDCVVGLTETATPAQASEIEAEVVWVPKTRGPAETVQFMLHELMKDTIRSGDRVVVLDCDTVVHRSDVDATVAALSEGYTAAVAVTFSIDPNMSRVDRVPEPTRFVEKHVISPYGLVSVRAFASAQVLVHALDEYCAEMRTVQGEPYLSPVLNLLPGAKYAHVLKQPWLDWGTPERIVASGARIL